jgi:hypothetical protein
MNMKSFFKNLSSLRKDVIQMGFGVFLGWIATGCQLIAEEPIHPSPAPSPGAVVPNQGTIEGVDLTVRGSVGVGTTYTYIDVPKIDFSGFYGDDYGGTYDGSGSTAQPISLVITKAGTNYSAVYGSSLQGLWESDNGMTRMAFPNRREVTIGKDVLSFTDHNLGKTAYVRFHSPTCILLTKPDTLVVTKLCKRLTSILVPTTGLFSTKGNALEKEYRAVLLDNKALNKNAAQYLGGTLTFTVSDLVLYQGFGTFFSGNWLFQIEPFNEDCILLSWSGVSQRKKLCKEK